MEAATGQEVELCLECIEWAKAEKRTFLRQALEVRSGRGDPTGRELRGSTDMRGLVCLTRWFTVDGDQACLRVLESISLYVVLQPLLQGPLVDLDTFQFWN